MFESYLRIIPIDYPETSWVQGVIFLRKHIQISWLDHFFKTKKKISKIKRDLKRFISRILQLAKLLKKCKEIGAKTEEKFIFDL